MCHLLSYSDKPTYYCKGTKSGDIYYIGHYYEGRGCFENFSQLA